MIKSKYIAQSPDGEYLPVTFEIHMPELDLNTDFRCKVIITELDIDQDVYGVDPFQTYCLSIKLLKLILNEKQAKGWQFYFPEYLDHMVDFNDSYF